ncbi:hypothetical protein ES708_18915 [subsurface metagenome]
MDMKNLFPELEEIKNIDLQSKVAKSLEKAIDLGGWKEEDLSTIPFTLLIPELIGEGKAPKINIIDHIRAVTQMCKATYERYEMLGLGDKLNRDELIYWGSILGLTFGTLVGSLVGISLLSMLFRFILSLATVDSDESMISKEELEEDVYTARKLIACSNCMLVYEARRLKCPDCGKYSVRKQKKMKRIQ